MTVKLDGALRPLNALAHAFAANLGAQAFTAAQIVDMAARGFTIRIQSK